MKEAYMAKTVTVAKKAAAFEQTKPVAKLNLDNLAHSIRKILVVSETANYTQIGKLIYDAVRASPDFTIADLSRMPDMQAMKMSESKLRKHLGVYIISLQKLAAWGKLTITQRRGLHRAGSYILQIEREMADNTLSSRKGKRLLAEFLRQVALICAKAVASNLSGNDILFLIRDLLGASGGGAPRRGDHRLRGRPDLVAGRITEIKWRTAALKTLVQEGDYDPARVQLYLSNMEQVLFDIDDIHDRFQADDGRGSK